LSALYPALARRSADNSVPVKFLSLVLRHRPDVIGIELTSDGWIGIDALLTAMQAHGHRLSRDQLINIVEANEKQRFAIDSVGDRIRANQGHSVPVDLRLPRTVPPAQLRDGHEFELSSNGVWLVEHVPPEYLSVWSDPPSPA
jgi:RNA:NAD 2'-phosphotransferase (TPT1/KptA family)